jgi:hypothetical protein
MSLNNTGDDGRRISQNGAASSSELSQHDEKLQDQAQQQQSTTPRHSAAIAMVGNTVKDIQQSFSQFLLIKLWWRDIGRRAGSEYHYTTLFAGSVLIPLAMLAYILAFELNPPSGIDREYRHYICASMGVALVAQLWFSFHGICFENAAMLLAANVVAGAIALRIVVRPLLDDDAETGRKVERWIIEGLVCLFVLIHFVASVLAWRANDGFKRFIFFAIGGTTRVQNRYRVYQAWAACSRVDIFFTILTCLSIGFFCAKIWWHYFLLALIVILNAIWRSMLLRVIRTETCIAECFQTNVVAGEVNDEDGGEQGEESNNNNKPSAAAAAAAAVIVTEETRLAEGNNNNKIRNSKNNNNSNRNSSNNNNNDANNTDSRNNYYGRDSITDNNNGNDDDYDDDDQDPESPRLRNREIEYTNNQKNSNNNGGKPAVFTDSKKLFASRESLVEASGQKFKPLNAIPSWWSFLLVALLNLNSPLVLGFALFSSDFVRTDIPDYSYFLVFLSFAFFLAARVLLTVATVFAWRNFGRGMKDVFQNERGVSEYLLGTRTMQSARQKRREDEQQENGFIGSNKAASILGDEDDDPFAAAAKSARSGANYGTV